MRVLSYNVQSLRGSRSGVIDVIRSAGADVVCLQEVPRFVLPALRARRLARACDLVAVGRGRLAGDTAMFVRADLLVRRAARVRLTPTPGLHRRGVTIASVAGSGGLVATVVSLHLGLDAAERARHVRETLDALALFESPYLAAGDINEGPGGDAWGLLVAGVGPAANADRSTYPAGEPRHLIDTVFLGVGLHAVVVEVLETQASDHCPVLADVAFG